MTPYPFTAVVGNERLKQALLANVVDPRIGGVLIRGDRGTAKTTVVRSLAALLPSISVRAGCPAGCDPEVPDCPFCAGDGEPQGRPARVVELPLGATEDRLAGTLDLERVLRTGERRLEPGLLASAHRGVLYIDEVNLLPDHLVDLLLDVAASGVNVVERDGNSVAHPARFILVGTMNPEEGELRPQLLDRFGLVVDASTPIDPEQRTEIIQRRIAFDRDPEVFAKRFAADDQTVHECIARARRSLQGIAVPASMVALAVDLCLEAQVEGVRADIALYRTATALAAIDGCACVEERHVFEAALLALPHRQRRSSDGARTAPPIDDIVQSRQESQRDRDEDGGQAAHRPPRPDNSPPGATEEAEHPDVNPSMGTCDDTQIAGERAPDHVVRPAGRRRIQLPPMRTRGQTDAPPGRQRRPGPASRGRVVGHREWDGRSRDVAPLPTIVASLLGSERHPVRPEDVRIRRRQVSPRRLVLMLVDGSGSMGARERMAETEATLLDILDQAAKHRDAVAVQVFRDEGTQLLVAPTSRLGRARSLVAAIPTGGRTPLAHGLHSAQRLLRQERVRGTASDALLVVLTDGRYRGNLGRIGAFPRDLAAVLVVDTESGPVRLGRARLIADTLGAHYAAL